MSKLSLAARRQLLEGDAATYAAKSGVSASRAVKSQIYGRAKAAAEAAGRDAQAARPVASAPQAGFVPKNAGVYEGRLPPINNMGENLHSDGSSEVGGRWTSLCDEHIGEVKLVLSDSGDVQLHRTLTRNLHRIPTRFCNHV